MSKNDWKVIKKDKCWVQLKHQELEQEFGNYQLCDRSSEEAENKLAESIIKAFHDYHKTGRKKRMFDATIFKNRTLVVHELLSGKTIAIFKLRKKEDVIKDLSISYSILNAYEEYYKKISTD